MEDVHTARYFVQGDSEMRVDTLSNLHNKIRIKDIYNVYNVKKLI